MKALKRFLILALALVMGLSLFACSDSSNDETPGVEPDTNNNNDNVDKPVVSLEAPDLLNYVFDYQALENGVISLDIKDEPVDVLFAESTSVEYSVFFEVNSGKVDVTVEEAMLDQAKAIKYVDGREQQFADITITINPITENYYNVDADTTDAGYTLATTVKATEVTFNGVAAGEGITVTDTGINFAKTLFTGDTMGHNKVEFMQGNTKYVLSVCAVTQKELDNPITFEDGKMSPFVAIYSLSHDAKVVDIFEEKGADGTSSLVDSSLMRYYISADGNTEVENRKQLAIKGDSMIYIASYYLNARVKKLETRTGFDKWDDNNLYSLTAKGFSGSTNEWTYSVVATESGEKTSNDNAFAFGKWMNNGANFTTILNYDMYNVISGANGDKFVSLRVPMGKGGYMYIDDIGATLDSYETHADAGGGTMWHGGNSGMHCQNPYEKDTLDHTNFRLSMDKVRLES